MVARRTKLVTGSVIFIVLAAVVVFFARTSPPNEPTLESERQQLTQQVQQNTISLPNAEAIPREHRDIAQPSSLWVLVSKEQPLADISYVPGRLVLPRVAVNTDKTQEEQSLRPETATALEQMLQDAAQLGHRLFMASGFRSYDLQKFYYDNYVAAYSQAEADTFSAKPGYSEHQTGLAFDLAAISRECYLEECFEDLPSGKWLAQNAHSYGFILRYPKGKESITGYTYEPWHFRYVGKSLAMALRDSGLTFDEAYPYLESN